VINLFIILFWLDLRRTALGMVCDPVRYAGGAIYRKKGRTGYSIYYGKRARPLNFAEERTSATGRGPHHEQRARLHARACTEGTGDGPHYFLTKKCYNSQTKKLN
jgi:hypothetical protein